MTSDDLSREYIEGCGLIYNEHGEIVDQEKIRTMSAEEIKVREEMNRSNTTERLRQRVIVVGNGRGNDSSIRSKDS